MKQETFSITVTLSEEEIKPGDLFFFRQYDGLPTIRRAKPDENWNEWENSKTGENPYLKIEKIEGVLISPRETFKNLTSMK